MIHTDNHLHSCFSSDSKTPLEDIINQSIKLNFNSICITDHHDIDYPHDQNPNMDFQLDTPTYISTLKELQDQYNKKIEIRIGVELGLMDIVIDKVDTYVKQYDFDFIIGSSHLVHGIDPYYPWYYEGRDEKTAYRDYFESILENVNLTTNFDSYGHLDYVVRYGPNKADKYYFEDYADIFEAILKKLIENGKGIEVNTASLYKGLGFPHPKKEILKLYHDLGGEIITIGSDSHVIDNIGKGFDVARDILLDVGFKYIVNFKNRQPVFIEL